MKYKGLHIGDLHVGAIPIEQMKYEHELIFKAIDTLKPHYITINGDLFDHKIGLNEEYSKYTFNFINKLLSNDIKLRVIRGTRTHDFNQLENFRSLEERYNFRIINTAQFENLFEDFRVLYVPEEYMENEDEFYSDIKTELKQNKADMIFGHGTFDVVAFKNQIIESERYIKGSPIFKLNEWIDYVNGLIIFGHIHVKQSFKKKLMYTGSYSRWMFGEEEGKGFIFTEYDTNKKKASISFINNNRAIEYKTIKLSNIINEEMTLQDVKDKISEYENSENAKYRIIFDVDIPTENVQILRESINSDNVKIQIKSNSLVKESEEDKKYKFLENNNDIYDDIRLFIQAKNGVELSRDTIIDILNDSE